MQKPMRKIMLLSLLAALSTGILTAQEKITSTKPLPIMAWAAIPAEETNIERFNELKEMGINVNLTTLSRKSLKMAH